MTITAFTAVNAGGLVGGNEGPVTASFAASEIVAKASGNIGGLVKWWNFDRMLFNFCAFWHCFCYHLWNINGISDSKRMLFYVRRSFESGWKLTNFN